MAFLLLASACTQEQAPVKDLGKQHYGRGRSSEAYDEGYSHNEENSYSSHSSNIYSRPVNAASVPSVSESDLPPVQGGKATGGSMGSNNYDSSSPFNTPPSKPLDFSTEPHASASGAAVQPEQPVYAKDGISLIWPVTGGKVIAHFKGETNDGINIAIANGEPIIAAASGTVVYAGNDLKDYGNMVILRHDNSWLTAYAHASRIAVKKGAYVKQGDIIAYVGASGGVKTPQLHFTLRKGRTLVDPEKYLPQN